MLELELVHIRTYVHVCECVCVYVVTHLIAVSVRLIEDVILMARRGQCG